MDIEAFVISSFLCGVWDLRSSGMLHRQDGQLFSEGSGQPIRQIFKS